MWLPRLNRQSVGYLVAQFFDTVDKLSGAKYDESNRPIMFGARHTWVKDGSGLPVLQTVEGTDGPVYGLFPWPGKAPRKMAQLSWVFPAKITSAGKATPIQTGAAGTGWAVATDLDEIDVFMPDGSAAAVGSFGVVVIGTELGAQKPLFFLGGGVGSTIYKVITNPGGGIYTLHKYDFPGGTADPGADVAGKEDNGSLSVPVGLYVEGTTRSDGNVWFWAPYGC